LAGVERVIDVLVEEVEEDPVGDVVPPRVGHSGVGVCQVLTDGSLQQRDCRGVPASEPHDQSLEEEVDR
jgi:hypothetical protein